MIDVIGTHLSYLLIGAAVCAVLAMLVQGVMWLGETVWRILGVVLLIVMYLIGMAVVYVVKM
jgi:hypothetical protein